MKRINILFSWILVLFVFTPAATPAQELKRIAILPFTIHADRDLTYLQEGILDMLHTRMAWQGQVQVVDKAKVKGQVEMVKPPLDREKALMIGRALGVDYVILGSVTVIGESVSLDARVLDVANAQEALTSSRQSKGMDEVIPSIHQFAQDINVKLMGREVKPQVAAKAPEPEPPKPTGAPEAPAREEPQAKAEKYGSISHMQWFPVEITGLDVGDVDGDGQNELVFTDKRGVYLYKWKAGAFYRVQGVEGGWSPNYVYVSLGDINGNGRPEVYVSNLSSANVSSLVLEWDGQRLTQISEGHPWFLRVTDIPGMGKTLVGQQRTSNGSYRGSVQVLKWNGKEIVPAGVLPLPRFGNVFNFVMPRLSKGEGPYTVMLSPHERLLVFDPQGSKLWESGELYGGSINFMEDETHERMGDLGKATEWVFFPSPIFAIEGKEAGTEQVVVCQNESGTRRIVEHTRLFSSGVVHFMGWNGSVLAPQWTSEESAGAVVGYAVADVNHDGAADLVVASVKRQEKVLVTPRSQILVYRLK